MSPLAQPLLAAQPLSDPSLDYLRRPPLRHLRHMPGGALEAISADRQVHVSGEVGAPGVALRLTDLHTGQRRRLRWLDGARVEDSGWQPALSPGQAAARQLDRWLSLFAFDANRSQRAALVGETAQNYHNILRGARGCSLKKIRRWVEAWNTRGDGPRLVLSGACVNLS